MEIKIIKEKLSKNMQNSFWYQNQGDVVFLKKNNREITISTCGEIRVQLPNDDFYRKNQQAINQALLLNLNDSDLENLEFGESNWFDFVYKKSNSEFWEEVDCDECFNYDKAIAKAKIILEDEEFWQQF